MLVQTDILLIWNISFFGGRKSLLFYYPEGINHLKNLFLSLLNSTIKVG